MWKVRSSLGVIALTTLVSACGGGSSAASPTAGIVGGASPPPPSSPPGSLQFDTNAVSVAENVATVTVTIGRSGGTGGAVGVTVASKDGTATSADYAAVNRTVTFADGDAAPKVVTIQITDDSVGELDETLQLVLSGATDGASLGANATFTVTIRDNDSPNAPQLSVGSDVRQLLFDWTATPGATSYRLFQKPSEFAPFTQLGGDIAPDQTHAALDIVVHEFDWANARYRLEVCNPRGCSTSTDVGAANAMVESIGYFKASNTDIIDRFGGAVALSADGTTLVVAAALEDSDSRVIDQGQEDNHTLNAGAIYVFVRNDGRWTQQAYLKPSNTQSGDQFGRKLALSADGATLGVGSPFQQDGGNIAAGAAYIFVRNGTQWSQQSFLRASNFGPGDRFGSSIALSSDGATLAVGAPMEDSVATGVGGDETDGSALESGAAYIFTRTGTQWTQQAYVKASNTEALDAFGSAVALNADGNVLSVGALAEDSSATGVPSDLDVAAQANNGALESGAVYVYTRAAGVWSPPVYLKASNTHTQDNFGGALALSADGRTLAVGAGNEDSSPGNPDDVRLLNSGAAFVFVNGVGGWEQQALLKASNAGRSDAFGAVLAFSADGNMLAVGAVNESSSGAGVNGTMDDDMPRSGAVYLFARSLARGQIVWGQRSFVKASNPGTAPSPQQGDSFGSAIALSGSGDMLAVGAPNEDSPATGIGGDQGDDDLKLDSGAVYLY